MTSRLTLSGHLTGECSATSFAKTNSVTPYVLVKQGAATSGTLACLTMLTGLVVPRLMDSRSPPANSLPCLNQISPLLLACKAMRAACHSRGTGMAGTRWRSLTCQHPSRMRSRSATQARSPTSGTRRAPALLLRPWPRSRRLLPRSALPGIPASSSPTPYIAKLLATCMREAHRLLCNLVMTIPRHAQGESGGTKKLRHKDQLQVPCAQVPLEAVKCWQDTCVT